MSTHGEKERGEVGKRDGKIVCVCERDNQHTLQSLQFVILFLSLSLSKTNAEETKSERLCVCVCVCACV